MTDWGDRLSFFGVVGPFLLGGIAWFWLSISWRGDAHDKWTSKVHIALSGLEQKAIESLRDLQKEANRIIGPSGTGDFDPMRDLADPTLLAEPVSRFQKCLYFQKKAEGWLNLLLKVLEYSFILPAMLIIGTVLIALHYSGFWSMIWVGVVSWILIGASIAGGAAFLVLNLYLQNRLQSAVILGTLSDTDGRTDD
jgi:hypothetical protein